MPERGKMGHWAHSAGRRMLRKPVSATTAACCTSAMAEQRERRASSTPTHRNMLSGPQRLILRSRP